MLRGLSTDSRSHGPVTGVLQPCEIDGPPISANNELADEDAKSGEIEIDDEITIDGPSKAKSADQVEANDNENSEMYAEQGCERDLDPQSILSACEDLHRVLQVDSCTSTSGSESPGTEVCSFELQTEGKQ